MRLRYRKEPSEVKKRIGIVPQDQVLDDQLARRENLDFHARVYGWGKKERMKGVLKLVRG
ncbi:TPA: hypothetical protein EYP26_00015 [Candidatus Bathyarchaeota archaeon]|nr:hypothetical protein [Candidatus Bathyarchaeota archaeon]